MQVLQYLNNPDLTKFFYLIERIDQANTREALLHWFTACSRPTIYNLSKEVLKANAFQMKVNSEEMQYLDKVLSVHIPKHYPVNDTVADFSESAPSSEMMVFGIILNQENSTAIFIKLTDDAYYAPFNMSEKFILQKGMIDNYDGEDIVTDVGKFFLNELLLVQPFGTLIPYLNDRFDPGKLDSQVAKLILDGKVNRTMYRKYMDNGYWYGEDGSISTACWSEKSLTTDPNVAKRKKELLEQYKDNLDDPVVLSKIEKELIAMDKAWIKGDSSEPFYAVGGGKVWNEQRKKMYVMFGLNATFSKDTGKFEFVADSLTDGWTAETLPVAANDIRRGSYGRGVETAKGGEQTKFVLRIFQEVSVDEEDCQTTKGIHVHLTKSNIKDYFGRWTVDNKLIDENTADTFLDKDVEIRSPLYCHAKPGFCYKCMGEIIRKVGIKHVGMQAIALTSNFTSSSMKSVHNGSIGSTIVKNFRMFLRQ